MITALTIAFAGMLFLAQNRLPDQHPAFEMAKDKSSITITSSAANLKVVFSSPEFHESRDPASPWEAGWTKVEVILPGRKLLCVNGRKYDPPLGYSPVFDGGRGFSPDGKYLTIFIYSAVGRDGSDGKGYFTFLDLEGCREMNFKEGGGRLADPAAGYWRPGEPHTYIVHRGGKRQETYPEPAEPKSGVTQK